MSLPAYPSFKEMQENLLWIWKLHSRYDESVHEYCKTIYENLSDDKIVDDVVQAMKTSHGVNVVASSFELLIDKTAIKYDHESHLKMSSIIYKYF